MPMSKQDICKHLPNLHAYVAYFCRSLERIKQKTIEILLHPQKINKMWIEQYKKIINKKINKT